MNAIENIDSLISYYKESIRDLQEIKSAEDKGGKTRGKKGSLVPVLAQGVVRLAWRELNYSENALSFKSKYKVELKIQPDYIKVLAKEIQIDIKENLDKYKYNLFIDVPVFYNNNLFAAIECKAYAENAMLKRVLFDAEIVRSNYPNIKNVLFQLESQMGGDYSDINKPLHLGSGPSRALMSFFPKVTLHVITLLEGDRKIDKPIHKKEYYKPLTKESVERAVATMKLIIKDALN